MTWLFIAVLGTSLAVTAPAAGGISVIPGAPDEETVALNAAIAQGTIEALQGFLASYPNYNALIPQTPLPPHMPPLMIDPTERLPALNRTLGESPTTTIY